MKVISFFSLLSFFINTTVHSQIVSNVRAFAEEGKVLIVYDLFTAKEEKEYYVTLSSSLDGKTYTKISDKISGDVLKSVEVGSEKKIIYSPEKPLEGMVFKVEGKRITSKIKYPIIDHPSGKVELLRVSWDKSLNLELIFKLENSRANTQFIFANFLMLDNQDVVYRKFMLENGSLFSVDQKKSVLIRIVVPNISEKATTIQKLEFNLSEIFVKMANIQIIKDEE